MRAVVSAVMLAAALLLAPAQASAKTFTNEQAARGEFERVAFVCPLGGETFRQAITHPHFPLATFPDGSHMGDEWIDQVIPECPGNGLLILPDYAATPEGQVPPAYYTYTAADLARLPGLLASAEWQALAGQTRTLRAYWLAAQLNLAPRTKWELLLHASWGAEDAAQRRTALEWLARDGPALIAAISPGESEENQYARDMIINANRELGRFETAAALSGREAALAPGAATAPPQGLEEDPLFLALAARDDDRFAIDMLTSDLASRICNLDEFASYRGPHAAGRCAAREQRARMRETVMNEAIDLTQNPAALDAQCAAVPEASRRPALAQACGFRENDRTQAEAERLLAQETGMVAEACWSGPAKVPTLTAMEMACSRYRNAMGGVIHHLLVRDAQAFALLCEGQPVTYEQDDEANLACKQAADTLAEIGALEMWKDLPALRRYCAKTELEQRSPAGITACVWTDFHDQKNPPDAYALEYRDGALFYDALSEHAVPYARKLIEKLMAERGGR